MEMRYLRTSCNSLYTLSVIQVTQVYMSWPKGTNNTPIRQLVGIARTHITTGQSATVCRKKPYTDT